MSCQTQLNYHSIEVIRRKKEDEDVFSTMGCSFFSPFFSSSEIVFCRKIYTFMGGTTFGMLFFASLLEIPSWGAALSNMILPWKLGMTSSRPGCLPLLRDRLDGRSGSSLVASFFFLPLAWGRSCESQQGALRRGGGTRIACLSARPCRITHH